MEKFLTFDRREKKIAQSVIFVDNEDIWKEIVEISD